MSKEATSMNITNKEEGQKQPPQSATKTTTIHPYFKGIQKTIGKKLFTKLQSSKLLVIGAGGIGCEILKNLSLCGCANITVIDLDTIDVSNLNRQFLFRSHHVKKPKCDIAINAVKNMTPLSETVNSINYISYHGNIKESRFGVSFYKGFDAVLNALDNMEARRHVNRLCLAANIPLIEAGTTGYLGQVTVIHKESGVECYECQPKPTQKVYPICTIRSTPSLPVHTVVWAKELYKLTFSDTPNNSMLFEDTTTHTDNGDNDDNVVSSSNTGEKSTFMDIILNQRPDKKEQQNEIKEECIQEFTYNYIKAFFNTEIQKQINMNLYKTSTKLPKVLDLTILSNTIGWNDETKTITKPILQSSSMKNNSSNNTMDIWTLEENILQILHCFNKVYNLKTSMSYNDFDKDDDLAMTFVTAASNLRSYQFFIGSSPPYTQSYYTTKGIAGNIIPAIATTNAIVAGLQVLQLFHILAAKLKNNDKDYTIKDTCKYIYCLRDKTRKGYYLQPTTLPTANPNCFVCQQARIDILLNVNEWTFDNFITHILKQKLGFLEPLVSTNAGLIYEESGDDDDDDDPMFKAFELNKLKYLNELPGDGIKHDSIIQIEDLNQDLSIDVCIIQKDDWDKDDEEKDEKSDLIHRFTVRGSVAGGGKKNTEQNENEEDENDDDVIIEDDEIEIITTLPKLQQKPQAMVDDTSNGSAAASSNVIINRKRSASIVDNDMKDGESISLEKKRTKV